MDPIEKVADLIEGLARGLVDDEDSVCVMAVAEQYHTNFKISVAPSDFGKLVGKGGVYADSMRTLIRAIGKKHALPQCELVISDPNPRRRKRDSGYRGGNY